MIEKQLCELTAKDRMVELLLTIPGCGEICAWTIRAYIDDIKRFSSAKKLCSYAGLAPRVQNSNEVIHHGSITKRGPKELRVALVQIVMGLRRMKAKTLRWRLMQRYEAMKAAKGSGKSIIATARKIAVIIWEMLSANVEFDLKKVTDQKLEKKAESMRKQTKVEDNAVIEEQEIISLTKNEIRLTVDKKNKKTGVARKKLLKAG